VAVAPTSQNDPRSSLQQQITAMMRALGEHESGMDYTNTGNGTHGASGAYQYEPGTWNNYGGYKYAYQAPPAVQDAKMRADVMAHYKEFGGDWTKVAAAHFYPAWANHPELWNQIPTGPGSNNPTMTAYVNDVMKRFGGGSGTPVSAGSGSGSSGDTTGTISSSDFATNFGYQAAFFDSDPSLKSVLNQALANHWYDSPLGLQHFQAALQNTTWYQKHSDAERQWAQLNSIDGKTAQRQIDAKYADLKASAVSMGVNVSDGRLRQMAVDSLKFGMTQQEDTIALGHEFKYTKQWTATGGLASQLSDQFAKSAYDYGVNISDKDKFNWVQDVLMGTKSSDAYNEHLKQQVKAAYPGMGKLLDSGMTTRQIAAPYLNSMQNILEIDPNSVDMTKDTTLRKAFTYQPTTPGTRADTAKSMDPQLMPTWQFEQTLRQDPRWMQTDNAQKSFMDTGVSILRSMGLVN